MSRFRMYMCVVLAVTCCQPTQADSDEALMAEVGQIRGLAAVVDCNDEALVRALVARSGMTVHALEADADRAEALRESLEQAGLIGRMSVALWDGRSLPYASNLVNLLVLPAECELARDEVLRVLVPGGLAVRRGTDGQVRRRLVKPWPEELDDWSHYLHDAGGNAVADDTVVGPPRRIQWRSGPRWTRAHEKMSSFHAMVSAGGRVFSILDEGLVASLAMPSRWRLVARDAFNGRTLWKRDLQQWWPKMFGFKAGPVFVTRRLVASPDRIYATLAVRAPLTILDAATGRVLKTCEQTGNVEEIILEGDTVFVSSHDPERTAEKLPTWVNKEKRPDIFSLWHPEHRTIQALDAETGRTRWRREHVVNPQTLAADDRRVYFHDGKHVVALDREDGSVAWRSAAESTKTPRSDFRANLVVSGGVVVFSGGQEKLPSYDAGVNDMVAFAADSGEKLWSAFHPHSGYEAPKDLFVIDSVVWSGATVANRPKPRISPTAGTGTFIGYELRTGREVARFAPDVPRQWFHHRCYPAKATVKYFLTSRQGVEFVDIAARHWDVNHWVRGACLYGVMPANGLLYAPPHPCGCRPIAKLNGFWALAPAGSQTDGPDPVERFEKGPAYGAAGSAPSADTDGWPMYRRDQARAACSPEPVPEKPTLLWSADPGGELTAPTISDGRVFIGRMDDHSVRALDVRTGRELWRYVAQGRVDTPPTICGDLALFGCRNGWVYAVGVGDGKLAWRRRIAPAQRLVMVDDGLESAWPVHGSVLVRGRTAWCLAGRSMFLDGGMHLVRLSISDGAVIGRTLLEAEQMARQVESQGHRLDLSSWGPRADILVAQGDEVFLKTVGFDEDGQPIYRSHSDRDYERLVKAGRAPRPHLFAPQGFLDGTWHHRSYTVFGAWYGHGSGGFYQAARSQPAGRLLVVDGDKVYGYGKRPRYYGWSTAIEYRLFATDRTPKTDPIANKRGYQIKTTFRTDWSHEIPLHVRGLAKAGDLLVLAGTTDPVDEGPRKQYGNINITEAQALEAEEHWLGKRGGWLWTVSVADGGTRGKAALAGAPVWDGVATTRGRILISLQNGRLVCLGSPE